MALLLGKIKIWQITLAVCGALAIALGSVLVLFFPDYWGQILGGLILVAAALTALIRRRSLKTDWSWLLVAISLVGAGFAFMFLLRFGMVRYFVGGGLLVVWLAFFINLFFDKPRRDWSQLISLAGIFLSFYSLGQLRWLLEINEWLCCLLAAISAYVFSLTLLRLADEKRAHLGALVIALVMVEIFWAGLFLPSSIMVLAALLTLAFYASTSFLISWLSHDLDRKRGLQYIILTVVLVAVVIGTASWFV